MLLCVMLYSGWVVQLACNNLQTAQMCHMTVFYFVTLWLAVSQHKSFVAAFSPWRPEFVPRVVTVGYVVDSMAPGQFW
jgi:hypothetical protein